MGEDLCDCEKLRTTGECNPNCVPICAFQLPLNKLNTSVIEKCLGESKWSYTIIKKEGVPGTEITSLKNSAEDRIEKYHEGGKESLKKNCPNCDLIPKILTSIIPVTPKKTCPEEYLKSYLFRESKKIDKEDGVCDKKKIFSYFESYVKSKLDKSTEESKKLWEDCPSDCSFRPHYSLTIDEQNCEGQSNLKIDCTHKARRKLLTPYYNIKVSYTGDLKCMGK
ncbi:MAG: hypothetical protein OXC37_03655 [Bdellovibrionaceae bacterium]|nr:hypothetical protein [Pseudobdellovibrionaceae bacterium]